MCRLPSSALPGERPGTLVLDEYAIAVVPHAAFLLNQLWPQEPRANTPSGTLLVGGVKYDGGGATAPAAGLVATRGDPLLKLGFSAGLAIPPRDSPGSSLGQPHGGAR